MKAVGEAGHPCDARVLPKLASGFGVVDAAAARRAICLLPIVGRLFNLSAGDGGAGLEASRAEPAGARWRPAR